MYFRNLCSLVISLRRGVILGRIPQKIPQSSARRFLQLTKHRFAVASASHVRKSLNHTPSTQQGEEKRGEEERIHKNKKGRERQKEEENKKTYFQSGKRTEKKHLTGRCTNLSLSVSLPLPLSVSLYNRKKTHVLNRTTHTSRTSSYLLQLPDRLPCRGLQAGQRPQKRRYRLYNQLRQQLQRHAHTPKSLQSSRR